MGLRLCFLLRGVRGQAVQLQGCERRSHLRLRQIVLVPVAGRGIQRNWALGPSLSATGFGPLRVIAPDFAGGFRR
jgi:hypothetical protein